MSSASVSSDGTATIDIAVDAGHRFCHGDWQGHDLVSLKAAGLLVRDPEWFQFLVCPKTGERYTVAAIRGGHTKAKYTRQVMERAAAQEATHAD